MNKLVFFLMFVPFISLAQEKCKCCTKNHEAFDFWVEEWDVFLPNGNKAGVNSIIKIQDNCILKENWRSANPDLQVQVITFIICKRQSGNNFG